MAPGKVAFGGTFNGNPLSLAGAEACLETIAAHEGRALEEANRAGERLMAGIRASAARHGIALVVTGFGAAFALHFTRRSELHDYRDTLEDDRAKLNGFPTPRARPGPVPAARRPLLRLRRPLPPKTSTKPSPLIDQLLAQMA